MAIPATAWKRPKSSKNGSTALAPLQPEPAVARGFSNGHLAAVALGSIADQFDPPEWQSINQAPKEFNPPDVVDWAHNNFIDPVSKQLIKLQPIQQRILRKAFEYVWADKVTTFVYSALKKSGKTAIAGLAGAYWGENVEAPNEIISVANDQEQAQGRIYAAMIPTMKRLRWDVPKAAPIMRNPSTESVIKAIGTNYAGEAGGNYGLTLWSELWAYKSEDRKRLWEEMTQVPTRRYSIRWIETYAGFKNESDILWDLYCTAFKDGDENKPLGKLIEGLEDIPLYFIEDAQTLVYWDHHPRMPWQTPRYYSAQRKELRPNAFKRLHQNEWVASEDIFIEPSQWDHLERCKTMGLDGDIRPIVLGADAGVHNDFAALVASTWDEVRQAPDLISTQIWRPKIIDGIEKPTIDLDETIGAAISAIMDSGEYYVLAVFYDPYQLHSVMLNMQKKYDRNGVKKLFVEFPQTNQRVKSDQYLYQTIVGGTLRHDGNPDLREHVLNAVVDETTRGFRLDKAKNKQKIDAAVAASMAAFGASVRNHSKRKFIKA